jgi:hypothetical protein
MRIFLLVLTKPVTGELAFSVTPPPEEEKLTVQDEDDSVFV